MKPTSNYQKHTSKNPLQRFLINNFYQKLLQMIEPLQLETILDAGCGEGFALAKLEEKGFAKHLEGIDFSQKAITIGKKEHPSLLLKQANIYQLPYKNNSFDLVLCSEVLEHLKEPDRALKEIIRVSKKYFLISVPNEPFFMITNFLRGKNLSRLGNDVEHINHWSRKSFEKFLKQNGLKPLIIKEPFPWIIVLAEK